MAQRWFIKSTELEVLKLLKNLRYLSAVQQAYVLAAK